MENYKSLSKKSKNLIVLHKKAIKINMNLIKVKTLRKMSIKGN